MERLNKSAGGPNRSNLGVVSELFSLSLRAGWVTYTRGCAIGRSYMSVVLRGTEVGDDLGG